MSAVFTSRPENYKRNISEGRRTVAHPAILTGPEATEPGVVIFAAGRLRMVLPAADAIRVADAIVDALETVQETA
ncbi:hypothetical protein [uncultured Arthrobacter sp.]|uniref:hypothetical protein n=1 Tax=uncultured Arthrobacter sp. TaxID=114050 RepID=UPI00262DF2A4|nr:hypothetical protein [uncultured Arthrobacter sp.]